MRGRPLSEKRRLGNWLESYLEFTSNTEPPLSYHRWTGLGCIAAALQRKVYMKWGMETIYPNLYIVLLGPAAQTRKSTALRIGEDILKEISIPMLGQDNSSAAVIRDIRNSTLNFKESDGTIKIQSAVASVQSELAVFLGARNTEFQAYMTDWYDCPLAWKRVTKNQGVDDITGMCFNLIGAMAPDWIPHVFSPESIGGGFTSRVIFVSEIRKEKTVADPTEFPPDMKLREDLIHDLELIHRIVGEFTLSKEAKEFYVEWYKDDDEKIQKGDFPIKDAAFHTYCGRRPTLLRKLSMVAAASGGSDRKIELADMELALKFMQEAEAKLPGTFDAVGHSSLSHQISTVFKIIQSRGIIKKSELLREVYKDITMESLDEIERTMEQTKMVRIVRETETQDSIYEWIYS